MVVLIVTAFASLLCSIAAKLLADHFLLSRVALLGSFAGLDPTLNPGIAFGVRFPPGFQECLILAALVLVYIYARRTARTVFQQIAFGLILGGALANILDRLPDGLVTDFFQVGSFPVFNVADSCITIGVILLICEAFLFPSRR